MKTAKNNAACNSLIEQRAVNRRRHIPDVGHWLMKKAESWWYLVQQASSSFPVQLVVQFIQRSSSQHRVTDDRPKIHRNSS